MFVALRDLRFARGRLALIGAVVALITLLVGFLAGLTGGLAERNVTAVLSLPADRIVLAAVQDGGDDVQWDDSPLTREQIAGWRDVEGVTDATPIGVTPGRLTVDDVAARVALVAAPAGRLATTPARDGDLVLTEPVAQDLGVSPGDRVALGGAAFTVESVVPATWHSHMPVVGMTLADWRAVGPSDGPGSGAAATAIALSGTPTPDAQDAADARLGTSTTTPLGSLTAWGSFRSEIGSLVLMVTLLFGISALVVGAFFTVWTLQRQGDVAVLTALGSSTRALVGDALAQAVVVLLVGIGLGLAVVVGLGVLVSGTLPFLLSPLTTVAPAALMLLLGLAGAGVAVLSVTRVDPLTALGSNR